MEKIKYIHAADLHIDAPFTGIARSANTDSTLYANLKNATFTALDRLVKLCLDEKPDFLILAGDIFNQEDQSLQAQLKLYDALKRLGDLPIFIAQGNHDPKSSWLAPISWHENIHFFDIIPERVPVFKDGRMIAQVQGISYARESESRNLAQLFSRDQNFDGFQIGVLHCALNTTLLSNERYAPCSMADLLNANLDAWALGHGHQAKILSQEPFIAYAGNTQGLHINETGPKGCYVVACERITSGPQNRWKFNAEFKQLNPIEWTKINLNHDSVSTLDQLDELLHQQLEKVRINSSPLLNGIITRIRLEGKTELNDVLNKVSSKEDLLNRLKHFSVENPRIWTVDLDIDTSDSFDLNEFSKRDDLAGEITRLSIKMENDENLRNEFFKKCLSPLRNSKKYGKYLPDLTPDQLQEILSKALVHSLTALENK